MKSPNISYIPANMTVDWFVDGVKVKKDLQKYQFQNGQLLVQSLKPSDTGLYQVVYMYDRGRMYHVILLNVTADFPGMLFKILLMFCWYII